MIKKILITFIILTSLANANALYFGIASYRVNGERDYSIATDMVVDMSHFSAVIFENSRVAIVLPNISIIVTKAEWDRAQKQADERQANKN